MLSVCHSFVVVCVSFVLSILLLLCETSVACCISFVFGCCFLLLSVRLFVAV